MFGVFNQFHFWLPGSYAGAARQAEEAKRAAVEAVEAADRGALQSESVASALSTDESTAATSVVSASDALPAAETAVADSGDGLGLPLLAKRLQLDLRQWQAT